VRYVPRDRYLTEAEFALLDAALPERRRTWVHFAVYTGARASEVEAVRWDRHVNLDGRQIILPGTKTAKSHRKIALAEPLAEILSAEARRDGPVVEPCPNVRRDLAAACKRAGISRVSPNDLRRTFASWLKQAGVDSMTVAKLLGHTSSRMVELVYGRLNDLTYQNAVAMLPSLPATPPAGSKWVANNGAPVRLDGQMRQPKLPKFSEVMVPRGGIEPPTRGFSVPCSTD